MQNLSYPYTPTHPGEVLQEEIEYRGISQEQLAAQLGIPAAELAAVLDCRRPVGAALALCIEAALGIEADMLTNMQWRYNMQTARRSATLRSRLARIRNYAAL